MFIVYLIVIIIVVYLIILEGIDDIIDIQRTERYRIYYLKHYIERAKSNTYKDKRYAYTYRHKDNSNLYKMYACSTSRSPYFYNIRTGDDREIYWGELEQVRPRNVIGGTIL